MKLNNEARNFLRGGRSFPVGVKRAPIEVEPSRSPKLLPLPSFSLCSTPTILPQMYNIHRIASPTSEASSNLPRPLVACLENSLLQEDV